MLKRALVLVTVVGCGGGSSKDDCEKVLDKIQPVMEQMAGKKASDKDREVALAKCRADAKEGDVGTPLAAVAKAHPETIIGSYPFIDEKTGPNTNIVVRARDAAKLAAAKAAVEAMLAEVHAATTT